MHSECSLPYLFIINLEYDRRMLVCLYEDRVQQLPGVKLLVLSLTRYCPDWRIHLYSPLPNADFSSWINNFPRVTLLQQEMEGGGSFNVKPLVLLTALHSGASKCLWIDTDILVNRNPHALFRESPETIIVTQDPWEYQDGSTHRAKTWGFRPERNLPGPLNSAVVCVTQHHIQLLEEWQRALRTDWYLKMQSLPIRARNQLALGDQDGLSALLASDKFSSIPVKRLKHPTEILQHHGAGAYSLPERCQTLRSGLPPLLHAMGGVKPWHMAPRPGLLREFRAYYERYYLELSPYLHAARQYSDQLGENYDWLRISTSFAKISHLASFGSPCLQGLAQASLHRAAMYLPGR
jgi:hypothetical protein